MKQQARKILFNFLSILMMIVPVVGFASGPYLQLSTYTGLSGTSVTIHGYQFGSSSTNVLVSLAGTSTNATVIGGIFTAMLTVPQVSANSYTVLATSPQREQAFASFYILPQNYYPTAHPSSWYVLPGQQLSFSGGGYAPNTSIMIQDGGVIQLATTDNSGNFSTIPTTVSSAWHNSNQTFTITSKGAYSIPLTLAVGTYYPNLNPSIYYIGRGQEMKASASGFAPGEPIALVMNGSQIVQKKADNNGSAFFIFTTPSVGNSFSLLVQGISSMVSSSRTITLY